MEIRVGILTAPKIEYERRAHTFVLKNVRIGIGFHWDREETQEFEGKLEIRKNADGTETAINIIDMEQYLSCVISSEMAANAPMELLKAHAVISRSWLLRNLGTHEGFDVCADDHCQRYEGIGRRNERAIEAVEATRGQCLTYDGEICDCRYHKCCGGKTEEYETCWEDKHIPYLESVSCPFCGRVQPKTLQSSLNDYDQETQDFHDWQVSYTQDELSQIIRDKSGIDFGQVTDLVPLKRGKSGRIYELQVCGTKHTAVIGKELTIRKYLSRSCLYSSWIDIHHENDRYTFVGKGWGHSVGLCQIGAAQMAVEGYTYEQILQYYYKHTALKKIECTTIETV